MISAMNCRKFENCSLQLAPAAAALLPPLCPGGVCGEPLGSALSPLSTDGIGICPTISRRVIAMRTTPDPKNEKLKLRLNEEMKTHIDKQSSKEHISLSEYVRQLVKRDMANKK